MSSFFDQNFQTAFGQNGSDNRIKRALPQFHMQGMASCFTNLAAAVISIRRMIACEESNEIKEEQKPEPKDYIMMSKVRQK